MTAKRTFLLSMWREWHARWGIFVLAVACSVGSLAVPARWVEGWSLFVLTMVLPGFAALAAAGGGRAADPFWRGLGGPSWARWAGGRAVHLLGIGLPMGILGVEVVPSLPAYFALVLALYGPLTAARALTSGIAVLLGPVVALGVVAGGAGIGWALQLWEVEDALLARLVAVGAVSLALAPWLDARFGPWGASVQRGAGRAIVGVVALVLSGGATFELVAGSFLDSGAYVQDFDAERVLRVRWRGTGWLARAWVTLEADGAERDLGPGFDGALGPHGAWSVARGSVAWVGHHLEATGGSLELHAPGGDVVCEGADGCWRWSWRPDGNAVAVSCGAQTWRLDASGGCEATAADIAWLGDREVRSDAGRVTIDGRDVGRLDAEVSLFGGGSVVVATGLRSVRGERPVWRIDDAGVHLFGGRGVGAYQAGGLTCARSSQDRTAGEAGPAHVCWRPDGSTVESDNALIDADHAYDPAGVVIGLRDGRRWTVPAGHNYAPWKMRFVPPDTVLVADGEDVRRVLPD